ncbi:hypothetical protein [Nitrososphaera sp.]|uniref:hypothetical protein n=1 Tax=Nitrososphaera sp. TaxID=1971748 RepID=UPI0017DBC6C0|nr:hypothetical protein [Nitrososphaera sp.]NWG36687.1 hypothetical protein [Nitrososphaera sp.]
MREAECKKRERKANIHRTRVIRNIGARGIKLSEKIEDVYLDYNDVKGLIGEILLEDMALSNGHVPVFIKWRKSGSSHSKGLDLIVTMENAGRRQLLVAESKHVHSEIKSAMIKHQVIMDKCTEALEQSDLDHVLTSLSRVIADFAENMNSYEATGGDVSELHDKYLFLKESLEQCSYQLEISVFSDGKYCTTDVFNRCMAGLPAPLPEYGQNIKIHIVGVNNLEVITRSMCGKFVEPKS